MKNQYSKSNIFGLIFFIFCLVYMIALLGTGLVALAPFAMALAALAAALIFIRTLFNKQISLFLWLSYFYVSVEVFIYFLLWGADGIGRKIWWNFVLILGPVLLSLFILFIRRRPDTRLKKITSAAASFLMIFTAVIYVFFMSLRAKPSVQSLQKGHDEYLNSISSSIVSANSPNVMVVLMDDMAYSDLSAYSYLGKADATIKTPNIDALADDGIYMENFYASAPVCTPSRFSLLTGRYAARGHLDNVIFPTCTDSKPFSMTHFVNPFQFTGNVDGLLGDEITIAEVLQKAGYNTACVGKWNLGDYGQYLPANQGFDYFYGSYYVNDMTPYNWVREQNGKATEVRTHAENLDQSESTRLFTDEIKNYISNSVDSNEKFFMYYATPWPHYPIYSDKNGNGTGDKTDDSYIDCIEEFDAYLGDIIGLLKDKGVYDDTLIVFTSDNGPGREGVAGALRGRKNTVFDGGMKVPLIATYKNGGIGSGVHLADNNRIEASAMLIDLFPTILRYVGLTNDNLPKDRVIDGKDLYDLWQGNTAVDTRVHDALYYMKGGKVQGIQMPVGVNGTLYDFKYYESVRTENSAFINQIYKNYLFNLDSDPAEGYNISMTYPDIADALHAQLKEFRKSLKENRRGIL